MAQSWRVKSERQRNPRPPLDAEGLERLGLFYAGRYATTRAKLATYLRRKLRERGWEGQGEPPVERLVARFAELGYVDVRAFASAKASSLLRRGYGQRRVSDALHAAGIGEEDSAPAREDAAMEKELAQRENDGIAVTLLWHAGTDRLTVAVCDWPDWSVQPMLILSPGWYFASTDPMPEEDVTV